MRSVTTRQRSRIGEDTVLSEMGDGRVGNGFGLRQQRGVVVGTVQLHESAENHSLVVGPRSATVIGARIGIG